MVKKFTIPFASQGDANDIPDALQVDGKVSFTQGFGYDYERPYDDPQAKDIAREDMNGLFKAITSAVGELQTLGASEWSNAISYPKGAIIYYEKDLYISQVDDNQNTPPQGWVSITSIANDSLKKAANLSDLTNKTTARNNLGLGSSAALNKTDVLGTSTSLVATQKLVNDTKINLENSKQDKLTFVGSGPEVMKAGAYGVGGVNDIRNGNPEDIFKQIGFQVVRLIGVSENAPQGTLNHSHIMNIYTSDTSNASQLMTSRENIFIRAREGEWVRILTEANNQQIGVGQKWVDVTSSRVADTTYTNNTGKPIMISIYVGVGIDRDGGERVGNFYIDGIPRGSGGTNAGGFIFSESYIIPAGSTYRKTGYTGVWLELR